MTIAPSQEAPREYVVPLDTIGPAYVGRVGGKNASSGEMIRNLKK